MKNEEKALFVKDLCARLPYKVKCYCMLWDTDADGCPLNTKHAGIGELCTIYTDEGSSFPVEFVDDLARYGIDDIKPYLRPMSSMTEEELNECVCQSGIKDIECPNWQDIPKEKQFEVRLNHAIAVFLTDSNNIDWLNSHHFDYRGLIGKGLALEAPEGMYAFIG